MTVIWVILAIVIGLELFLRLVFGFGKPLIYVADEEIGYLLAPNQHTRRFGNRIEINQYSMRSPLITVSLSRRRVLLLGDSVANGGSWTDQAKIPSVLMQHQLQADSEVPVEVLNASANSWCPRNQLAYIERFGIFEARVVVLLINTDDLFGTAPTSVPVGRDRFYPSCNPFCAIAEAITYYLPYQPPSEMAIVNAEVGDRVGRNLEAIAKIKGIATQANAQFLLAMTPLLREIGEPGSLEDEIVARERLIKLTQDGINYIDFLPLFRTQEQPERLFRDTIHLNLKGNQLISETLVQAIQEL